MKYLAVFSTVPSEKVARQISVILLKKRLAACVNVIPGLTSSFWWKGKIERCRESLLLIKTRKSRFRALERSLKKIHPYEVPEIIALPIERGNEKYLAWIAESLED